jgi:glutamate 5-kinase
VKIGSSSLTAPSGHLDVEALESLVNVISSCRGRGQQVVLVTSGAVAAGLGPLGFNERPTDLASVQAAASVGQGILVARYADAFAAHGLTVGQVLLTAEDTVRRRRYKNAQRALLRLLELGVVPVINENDAVTTAELKFGDNDRLAALVAHLVSADALVLLTDVDGLHTHSPRLPGAERIPIVTNLDEVADVPISAYGSAVGTGGMVTKLDSVRIATGSGVPVILTKAGNVARALRGDDVGTYFAATGPRASARKLWIAHAAGLRGTLYLDDGAVHAITDGHASLLPAGVTRVEGTFEAGEPVELRAPDGTAIARGLSSYPSSDLPRIIGRHTGWLRDQFGDGFDRAVVHRDDLIVGGNQPIGTHTKEQQ